MAPVVDPNKRRDPVSFQVGNDTYVIQMAVSQTKGSLFQLMGYSRVTGDIPQGALEVKRADALENGLVLPLTAECRSGNRVVYRRIYCPTPKIEETIRGARNKTIGSLKVLKVRAQKNRLVSA